MAAIDRAQAHYDRQIPPDGEETVGEIQARYEQAAAGVTDDDLCDDIITAWPVLDGILKLRDRELVGRVMVALYEARIERLATYIAGRAIAGKDYPLPVATKALFDALTERNGVFA